jgi:Spx/MgsR family transcriptional regulator
VITLYGINNCDTVRKARRWLEAHGIEYRFHDLRQDGLDSVTLQEWLDELGWQTLVNKRSTTWKQLDPALREGMDAVTARAALLEHPTLIKRPVLDLGHQRLVGFSADSYQTAFNLHTL